MTRTLNVRYQKEDHNDDDPIALLKPNDDVDWIEPTRLLADLGFDLGGLLEDQSDLKLNLYDWVGENM